MRKTIYFGFCITFISLFIQCENGTDASNPQLLRRSFQSQIDQKEKDYFLYLPKGYPEETQEKFPVLLFLHGNGERGNGKSELDYTMTHGPLYEAWIQKRDLPFIIIVPQLPMFGMDQRGLGYIDDRDTSWIPKRLEEGVPPRDTKFSSEKQMLGAMQVDTFPRNRITLPVGWDQCEADLLAILQQVFEEYKADKKRTYLSGLSYGGFGTWWMASKHPELFAAINPIVGWGHPDLMAPIAEHQIPVWAFCGGRDEVIPARYFYQGLNKLETLGHQPLRFTIEADMGHDVWRRVYAGEDIYDWFLKHQK